MAARKKQRTVSPDAAKRADETLVTAADYSDDLPDLPPKLEKFALGLLRGETASDAMRNSRGTSKWKDTTLWLAASRARADPRVQAWLKLAKSVSIEKAAYTFDKYMSDLKRAAELAKEAGQIGAMVAAIKEMGIASGHRVEKREITERKSMGDTREEVTKLFTEAQALGLIAPGDSAKVIDARPKKPFIRLVTDSKASRAAPVGTAGPG